MQINHFKPLIGLSKPSISSSIFSFPRNKTTVFRNILEKQTTKVKFPSAQMLSLPPCSISVFRMFLNEREKRSSLQYFPNNAIILPFICMDASMELHYSFRGLWERGENIILICIKPVTELSIFASSC